MTGSKLSKLARRLAANQEWVAEPASAWKDLIFQARATVDQLSQGDVVTLIVSLQTAHARRTSAVSPSLEASALTTGEIREFCNDLVQKFRETGEDANVLSLAKLLNALYRLEYFDRPVQPFQSPSASSRHQRGRNDPHMQARRASRYFHTLLSRRGAELLRVPEELAALSFAELAGLLHSGTVCGFYDVKLFEAVCGGAGPVGVPLGERQGVWRASECGVSGLLDLLRVTARYVRSFEDVLEAGGADRARLGAASVEEVGALLPVWREQLESLLGSIGRQVPLLPLGDALALLDALRTVKVKPGKLLDDLAVSCILPRVNSMSPHEALRTSRLLLSLDFHLSEFFRVCQHRAVHEETEFGLREAAGIAQCVVALGLPVPPKRTAPAQPLTPNQIPGRAVGGDLLGRGTGTGTGKGLQMDDREVERKFFFRISLHINQILDEAGRDTLNWAHLSALHSRVRSLSLHSPALEAILSESGHGHGHGDRQGKGEVERESRERGEGGDLDGGEMQQSGPGGRSERQGGQRDEIPFSDNPEIASSKSIASLASSSSQQSVEMAAKGLEATTVPTDSEEATEIVSASSDTTALPLEKSFPNHFGGESSNSTSGSSNRTSLAPALDSKGIVGGQTVASCVL
uniref:Uncharacterized protein n=1 Tax=Chromera velia CCMP2878 TaxID=1169474 RepID=A0A0G4HB81_9ALVE|eukprot:Cvel_6180.t1-p1 / transcript=Cvel_6180.t1 / gene=Cvel_6180 / organism=Chromera_velia_CCMP2878 / gene_product=hypothetical protein / transcript_product=hypothetical protein / location=Cvel_scaffold299:43163-47141(+) / protein_length=633 / sequence_SO=supercontig / SO=protein_coding / is_pseudo=false